MSWITNLAGKAENILNIIDSEAASVLTKELKNPVLNQNETSSLPEHKRSSSLGAGHFPSSSSIPSNLNDFGKLLSTQSEPSNSYRESGSLTTSPKKRIGGNKTKDQERSLIDFLNDTKGKNQNVQGKENLNPVHSEVGHSRQSSVSSASSFLAVSGRETPGFTALEIETNSGGSHSSDAYINVESPSDQPISPPSSFHSNDSDAGANGQSNKDRQSDVVLLRKEITSLNQEMAQVLKRAKESEKEAQRLRDQLSTLSLQQRQSEALLKSMQEKESELMEKLKSKDEWVLSIQTKLTDCEDKLQEREKSTRELHEQNQRLLQGVDASNSLHSDTIKSLQDKVRGFEDSLSKEKSNHAETEKHLTNRIYQLEEERNSLSKDLSEAQKRAQDDRNKITSLNNQIASLKSECSLSRNELADYKSKAGRILQSKDTLIASLKEGKSIGPEDSVHPEEMEQLRGERDLLREELERCGEKIKTLTEEYSQMEALTQHEALNVQNRVTQLEEEVLKERSDSSLLQEELRQSKQDLRCIQEELTRQRMNFSSRMQERDAEVERLQKQIAHKQSSSSSTTELENRIHGLTESLIHKQNTIEALSTDKHTLQIQLEKLQQQYNESQCMLNKDLAVEVPTDEVRNRVPSFLMESPFDGGVTRRVKKAYGSLDKFSVRLGVFLRRYPTARVFVLLYMGLLHAWVMIVLLTYKPEIHGPDFEHHAQLGHFVGSAPRSPD